MAVNSALAQRRMRRGLRAGPMLAASLAVLVIGWCLLWVFARWEADRSFADWIAAEREQGRIWTCPDRRIGGFPLAIVLTCKRPTFAEEGNGAFKGELAGLRAKAHLYFPTSVAIDLNGPLTIRDASVDAGLTISWSDARVTLRGDIPGDLDRGQLEADIVDIGKPGGRRTRIGHAEVGFRPLAQKATGPEDAELIVRATDVSDPEADAVFGSGEPMAARLRATISRLPGKGASLPTLLENWRSDAGRLELDHFAFSKGSFRAEGSGQLQIDDEHRLEGRLETRFAGLEPVAARFGIPTGAVRIGGMLSGLLGGKTEMTDASRSDLNLPIVARNGRLYLGPAKTSAVLSPLY